MAVNPDAVNAALTDVVSGPKTITTTSGSIGEHPIPDLIELQKKAAGDAAVVANTKTRGLRFNKFSHRSTTG